MDLMNSAQIHAMDVVVVCHELSDPCDAAQLSGKSTDSGWCDVVCSEHVFGQLTSGMHQMENETEIIFCVPDTLYPLLGKKMRCTAFHVFAGKVFAGSHLDLVVNGHFDQSMRFGLPL